MAAYIVVQIAIHDPATYEQYKALAPASIAAYGGRYVVRGGRSEVLEGSWQPTRLVVLEFPSVAQARAWWESPEYAPAKALRQRCAQTEMLLIEGAAPTMPSELDRLRAELREILAGRAERQEKARLAAAAIGRLGGYRWVGLYDVGATEIRVIGWAGPGAPAHPTFRRDQGLNGAAVASGEAVIVQDVSADARYLSTLGSTRAEMIMPVRTSPGGAVVGTIDVESDRVHPFTEHDRALLSACADALVDLWRGAEPSALM